ncbi:MAG: hypothetical protein R2824_11090 [Saprospiraceae bacterium]|nr:hypothetical protein [Lewinella sp.]
MSQPNVHIHLTCIYAYKDLFIQQNLSSHLERLHLEEQLDAVRFMEVNEEAFAEHRFPKEVRESDIYLILLSPHLMATPFAHSAYLKKVIAAHQFGNVKLLPILVADGDYSKTILGRMERLHSNELPLKNTSEFSLEANMTLLVEELKMVIIDWMDKKQELVARWEEAREEDERQYYENFLKDYPHSIYREAAQKRYNELKEDELWRTAKIMDNVHHYYLYLRDSPLQLKRVDAINRITEIEQDEQVGRDDSLQSDSLPMLFDYKVRFPNGSAVSDVNKRIKKLEEDRLNHLDEPEYIKTEAYYLQYLAYEKLNKDELLSLRLMLNYAANLLSKSRRVSGAVSSSQMTMVVIGFLGISTSAYTLGPLIRYAVDGVLSFQPFVYFVCCVAGFFLAARAYIGYRIAAKDAEFCELTANALKRSLVTIKIHSIDHDYRELFQETSALIRIDKSYDKLSADSVLTYLFGRSAKGSVKQEEVIKKLPLPLKG